MDQTSLDGIAPAKPATKRATRPSRDAAWKTLFATMIEVTGGYAPIMLPDQGRFAKAVDHLRAHHVTPEDLADRARRYRLTYPGAKVTPPALVRHWSSLTPPETIRYARPATTSTQTTDTITAQRTHAEAERAHLDHHAEIAKQNDVGF